MDALWTIDGEPSCLWLLFAMTANRTHISNVALYIYYILMMVPTRKVHMLRLLFNGFSCTSGRKYMPSLSLT